MTNLLRGARVEGAGGAVAREPAALRARRGGVRPGLSHMRGRQCGMDRRMWPGIVWLPMCSAFTRTHKALGRGIRPWIRVDKLVPSHAVEAVWSVVPLVLIGRVSGCLIVVKGVHCLSTNPSCPP